MEIMVGESPIPGVLAGNLNDLEPADVAYRNLGNVRARSWAGAERTRIVGPMLHGRMLEPPLASGGPDHVCYGIAKAAA